MSISILMLLGSCNKPDAPDCFKKAGANGVEWRDSEAFHSIEVRDYFTEVLLYPSENYRIAIESPENLIPKITTDIRNGILTIGNDNRCNFVRSFKHQVRIRVFAPDIRAIRLFAGAGDFTVPEAYLVDSLAIEGHDFVGIFIGNFTGRTVNAELHAGLGDAEISGQLEDLHLYNLGYGYIDTHQLESNRAFVNNGSTNAMSIKAPEWYLFCEIRGSGNVKCQGTPPNFDLARKGTGELIFIP
jgi:hypothetical protein